jgi:hypothetical protein
MIFNACVVFATNNYLKCAVLHYSTLCINIFVWKSYQEQLEMDTEICRL